MYAALALYRFYHNGNGIFRTLGLEILQIIKFRIGKSLCHGAEADLAGIVRLPCGGHGAEGSSMEAVLRSYDMVFLRTVFLHPVFSGHLNHSLVRLCSGVLIEDLVHADGGADFFREKSLRNRIRIVECLHQIRRLTLHSLNHSRIAVSRCVDGNARVKIKIRGSLFIVHIHAASGFRKKIKPLIGLDHIFFYFILNILRCKSRIL